MADIKKLIVFTLDEQRYAFHLEAVQRVVLAVEITPLPKAPEIVLGVINLQGRIIPVVNFRKRCRLPERALDVDDQFIIACTLTRTVAVVVDRVTGVAERQGEEILSAEKIVPGIEHVEGVAKLADGIVLIHDLDKFLSFDEESQLSEALGMQGGS